MIAPFLKQMGVTRAIPLSVSQSSSYQPQSSSRQSQSSSYQPQSATTQPPQSPPPTEMDLSCLRPWTRFNTEEAITSLQQRCYDSDPALTDVARMCLLIHSSQDPCFYCVDQLTKFIAKCCDDSACDPLVLDVLTVLVPHLPLLAKASHSYEAFSMEILSSLTTLLMQLIHLHPFSERIVYVAILGVCALCTQEMWKDLQTCSDLEKLFHLCCSSNNDVVLCQIVKTCFLATCCEFVDVSGNSQDASEECLKVIALIGGDM